LVDLNGNLGRIFGGIGVGIDHPNVIVEAQASNELIITGEENQLVQTLTKRFFDTYKTKTTVSINVKKSISSHVGLGSGTQLSLAIATALSRVLGVNAATQELALIMGRAQRTGVGTAIFQKGGLVVDGGKINNNGVIAKSFPPLIFRQEFPKDWHFVVVVPNVKKGLNSQEETSAFKKLTPMPVESVGNICRLTMMKLLPALVEHDIQNFGEALTNIQIITGDYFAQVQGGTYASSVSSECIKLMQKLGAHGVGQSSWGPALYGAVQKEQAKEISTKVQAYLNESIGGEVFVARPNNNGAVIKSTP
jgi:beta-RFAP synthase